MESFTVPAIETEWPDDQYFADPSEINDVDGVLEGMGDVSNELAPTFTKVRLLGVHGGLKS